MGFPGLSVHRTKRKRRNVSGDYKTNLNYARVKSHSNVRCYGSTITSDRLEKQKTTTGNGENQYGSGGNHGWRMLEFTHPVFINLVYLFTPVLFHKDFCLVFQKTMNKERKLQRRENGRMEEKWAQFGTSSQSSTTHRHLHRFNFAPSSQRKGKCIGLLFK